MALSEREQQLLDEMERNLSPDRTNKPSAPRTPQTQLGVVLGILVLLIGVAAMIAGVVLKSLPTGVLGFLVMFAGTLFATGSPASVRLGQRKL